MSSTNEDCYISHTMGRNSVGVGLQWLLDHPDLTRYSAPGVLVCDGSLATTAHLQYFSVNGGRTVLAYYSDTSDYGDWASTNLTASDSFNAYIPSNSNALTSADIAALDAIGYTIVTPGGRSSVTPGATRRRLRPCR